MTGKAILVVDDEPNIARQLSFVLQREDFNVLLAGDGEEALRKVREERPWVVLLDVMLPRMSGYEVFQEIQTNPAFQSIPLVMMSGRREELAAGRRHGGRGELWARRPCARPGSRRQGAGTGNFGLFGGRRAPDHWPQKP